MTKIAPFPFQPSAGGIITWGDTNPPIQLCNVSVDIFRQKIVEIFRGFDNLGITDDPPGRKVSYLDACSWDEVTRRAAVPNKDLAKERAAGCPSSSCGLFLHNMLAFAGARGLPLLETPYRFGSVIEMIRDFGKKYNSAHLNYLETFKKQFVPKIGDILYITTPSLSQKEKEAGKKPLKFSHHIFLITDVELTDDSAIIHSIDGGQMGKEGRDGPCNGVQTNRREIIKNKGSNTFSKKFKKGNREIHTWINIEGCQPAFTGNWQEIRRNPKNSPLVPITKPVESEGDPILHHPQP